MLKKFRNGRYGRGATSSGSETLVLGSNGRYLVLFASRSGNTGRVADEIRRQLDCDMLEVVPSVAYASDYHDMLDQARRNWRRYGKERILLSEPP